METEGPVRRRNVFHLCFVFFINDTFFAAKRKLNRVILSCLRDFINSMHQMSTIWFCCYFHFNTKKSFFFYVLHSDTTYLIRAYGNLFLFLPQARGLDLSRVRACVVVAEERPRMALTHSFSKLFKDLGLHPRSVSTAFGCRVNLAICLQVESAVVSDQLQQTQNLCLKIG